MKIKSQNLKEGDKMNPETYKSKICTPQWTKLKQNKRKKERK